MTPSEAVRSILRWAALGLAVIVTAFVVAFLVQQGQVTKIERLGAQNRQLITEIDQLNRTQADQAYAECVTRNKRARQSIKAFQTLVAAHRRDGSTNAANIWQGYLDDTRRTPLPPCKRPTPPPPTNQGDER